MSSSTKIKISRSKYVERDRHIAILRLNTAEHLTGQPVMVRYYTESGEIDTIFAIGIKDGIGADCYKVISMGGVELVWDVVTELPDISSLVHGELYLYRDEKEIWYYVYEADNTRQIEEIKSPPTIFLSIKDNYRWFWRDGQLKREDDFLSAEESDDVMGEVIALVYPATITVTSLSGNIFETGIEQNIDIKVDVVSNGVNITKSCNIFLDNRQITLSPGNLYTIKGVNSSKDYKFTAKYLVNKKELSTETVLNIRFGHYVYYGTVKPDWEPNEGNIKLLQNKNLSIRSNTRFSNISLDLEKTIFAYPTSFGELIHIYDANGLDYINDYNVYKTTFQSPIVPYNVYVKKHEVTIDNFLQEFIFVSDDTTEQIAYSRIIELENAWKNQNAMGGFVILDENGKIPEEILPNSGVGGGNTSLTRLVGFVSEYPTYNMISGQKWYNTETEKIFTATSDSTGEISDPVDNEIYLIESTGASYVWNDTTKNMDNLGGNVMSNSITDISDIL